MRWCLVAHCVYYYCFAVVEIEVCWSTTRSFARRHIAISKIVRKETGNVVEILKGSLLSNDGHDAANRGPTKGAKEAEGMEGSKVIC
jgi:hypothetical protein